MLKHSLLKTAVIAVLSIDALAQAPRPSLRPTTAVSPAKQVPATPPPMGWSSWNSFSNTVDAQVVMAQAKAMVSTGMAKAGGSERATQTGTSSSTPNSGPLSKREKDPVIWPTSCVSFTTPA